MPPFDAVSARFSSDSAARRRDPSSRPVTTDPRAGPRLRIALAALAALLCTRCVPSSFSYTGTGTLQLNGSAMLEVAQHSLGLADCHGHPSLSIAVIGDRCELVWWDGVFTPDARHPCVLHFAGRDHTLRVTDAITRFASRGRYTDTSLVGVRLGADDLTTGAHALYELTASATDSVPDWLAPQADGEPSICPWRPHPVADEEPERH